MVPVKKGEMVNKGKKRKTEYGCAYSYRKQRTDKNRQEMGTDKALEAEDAGDAK